MKKIAILRQRIMSDVQTVAISIATIRRKRTDFWERTKVDTTAFLIFGMITGAVTALYEVVIVGVTAHQWFVVRILYTLIRCLGVYFLGKITDSLRKKIAGEKLRKAISDLCLGLNPKIILFITKGISDGISLSIYQIPVYVFSAFVCGVEVKAIFLASLLYIGDNFLFGWFFGYILDRTRAHFTKMEKFFFICVGEKSLNNEDTKKVLKEIAEATEDRTIKIFSSPNDKAIEFANIVKEDLDIEYKIDEILNFSKDCYPFKIHKLQKFLNKYQNKANCIVLITYYEHCEYSPCWLKNSELDDKFNFPVDSCWEYVKI